MSTDADGLCGVDSIRGRKPNLIQLINCESVRWIDQAVARDMARLWNSRLDLHLWRRLYISAGERTAVLRRSV